MEVQIGRTSIGEASSQKDEGSRVGRVCSAGQFCSVLVQPGVCIMQALSIMQQGARPSRLLIFAAGYVVGMQAVRGCSYRGVKRKALENAAVEAIIAV